MHPCLETVLAEFEPIRAEQAAVALAVELDPLWLMVPAAMSASCAFMLPVATAPNAVVFGSGELPIQRMVREGFVLNLIGAAVIATVAWGMLA